MADLEGNVEGCVEAYIHSAREHNYLHAHLQQHFWQDWLGQVVVSSEWLKNLDYRTRTIKQGITFSPNNILCAVQDKHTYHHGIPQIFLSHPLENAWLINACETFERLLPDSFGSLPSSIVLYVSEFRTRVKSVPKVRYVFVCFCDCFCLCRCD